MVDPDPFSTILIVLGALGSIASLYAVVEQRITTARIERETTRYAIRDVLMSAETSLNELRSYIRSLEIAFSAGATRLAEREPMMSIVGFGSVPLLFTRDGHVRWREIEDGVLTTVGRVQRSMGELLRQFSVTRLRLPPDTGRRIQTTTERLNAIVLNLGKFHFQELFRLLDEAASECMDTLRQIRVDLGGYLRERP